MTDKTEQIQDGSDDVVKKGADTEQAYDFTPLARRFLWAESMPSVERVIFYLSCLCVVLFILDFIVHRHSYAPGEGIPGFYAVVGFVAFTLIVLGAKQLRRLILRNEQYYAPFSVDAEDYPDAGLEKTVHQFDSARTSSDKGGDS